MSEPDPVASLLAQKNLEQSSAAVKDVRQELQKQQEKSREAYEKFHNNLALFSSGTIVLSVTFLGYLRALPNRPVVYPRLLMASWIVLLICVLTSLFYSFFYSHYAHFIASGGYISALEKNYRTTAEAMDNLELVNLGTPAAKKAQQSKWYEEAGQYAERRGAVQKKERRYFWLWLWCGRVSRFAFPLGLVLLVLFAIKNF
jgi:hypothetical protein